MVDIAGLRRGLTRPPPGALTRTDSRRRPPTCARRDKGVTMTSSLKGLTIIAGIACAILGAGPVDLAAAAPSPSNGSPASPGSSCGENPGQAPSNLGPTGPLGPLGPYGPGGGGNKLPCGSAATDVGPAGPLGPGGALGSGALAPQRGPTGSPGQQPHPAQRPSPARTTAPARPAPKKHGGHARTRGHRAAKHPRPHSHRTPAAKE